MRYLIYMSITFAVLGFCCATKSTAQDAAEVAKVKNAIAEHISELRKKGGELKEQLDKLKKDQKDDSPEYKKLEEELKRLVAILKVLAAAAKNPDPTKPGSLPSILPDPKNPSEPSLFPDPRNYPNNKEGEQAFKDALKSAATLVCTAYPPYCPFAQLIAAIFGSLFGENDPKVIEAKTNIVKDLANGEKADEDDLDIVVKQKDPKKAQEDVANITKAGEALQKSGTPEQKKAGQETNDSVFNHPEVKKWIDDGNTTNVKNALALAGMEGKKPDEVLAPFAGKYESENERFSFLYKLRTMMIKSAEPAELVKKAETMKVGG